MLNSRCSGLIRCISRQWTREFSVTSSVCAPRMNRTGPTDDLVSQLKPALPSLQSNITEQYRKLMPNTTDKPAVSVVDLTEGLKPKPLPEGSAEAKEMYKTLVTSSADEVINMVVTQHQRMNKVHYALAMKRLFRIAKDLEGDELQNFKIRLKQERGFQVLVSLVALKGEYYEGPVAADMLRFMCVLGLDSDHPALQVYLQLIKYHINDVDLDVLVRLMHSLTQLTVTSQTEVLKKAIAVLCNLRSNQIPALNTWQLATLVEHCADHLEESVLQQVLEELLNSPEGISARLSAAILQGLSRVDAKMLGESSLVEHIVEIITFCVNKLHNAITTLEPSEINNVLTSLGKLGVYDADFCNNIGTYYVQNKCVTISDMIILLGHFHKQSYHHGKLVEQFRERLPEWSNSLCQLSQNTLVTCLRILSDTSPSVEVLNPHSRNPSQTSFIKLLCSRILHLAPYLTTDEIRQCSLDMAVLGETFLSRELKVSSELSKQPDSNSTGDESTLDLLRLYQAHLSQSYTELSNVDYDHDVAEMGRALRLAVKHTHQCLCPKSNKLSFLIDYLLLVNKDGSVLPYQEHQLDLENLLEDTSAVAVKTLHDNSYHRNTGQLRGYPLLCGRLLQQDGYLVIFLNYNEWRRMDERDRIPYLIRRVENVHLDQNLHVLPSF